MSAYQMREGGFARPLTADEAEPVTVTLPREALERTHELLVARAVTIETTEEAAQADFGSGMWRAPANEIRRALAGRQPSGAPVRVYEHGDERSRQHREVARALHALRRSHPHFDTQGLDHGDCAAIAEVVLATLEVPF